jgi:hypothetical protein
MRFSNDNITRSDWEVYTTNTGWTLTSGSGTKTVYAEFDIDGDGTGDVSINDSIESIILSFCDTVTDISTGECEGLIALYESTNGSGWINQTNRL